jgi:SAM-dependent methyltransferase
MTPKDPDSGVRPSPPHFAPRSTVKEQPDTGQVVEALGVGASPPDAAFDHFLSDPMRSLSARHWTPLAVAVRAAQWFDECNIRTVVDIGSGAGKFCVAAALAGYCHFTGLEHRARLVASARRLAHRFGVEDRTHFIYGALGEVRLPSVDAYYLFNPFEENVAGAKERIDESVELSSERWTRDLRATHALLSRAAAGTYVLIYNGFGGVLPTSYRRVRLARELPNPLCLWRKAPSRLICRWQRASPAGCADAA